LGPQKKQSFPAKELGRDLERIYTFQLGFQKWLVFPNRLKGVGGRAQGELSAHMQAAVWEGNEGEKRPESLRHSSRAGGCGRHARHGGTHTRPF
jgi:hypothetical protein